jgi:hypothetical protein
MGPRGRKLGHWGHALGGNIGTPAPAVSLLPGRHEVNRPHYLTLLPQCTVALRQCTLGTTGPKQPWTKTVSQNKPFLL